MLNNTEYKSQSDNASAVNPCASVNSAHRGHSSKSAERRLHREFRQRSNAGSAGSGWRVTLW